MAACVALCAPSYTGALRVMPLGDSITAGDDENGTYRLDLWYYLQSAGVSVDFVGSLNSGPKGLPDKDHEGHWAWHTFDFFGPLEDWVAHYQPDVVLLMIGSNDVFTYDPVETIAARLDSLVATVYAYAPGALVLVASIPPIDNASITERAEAYNLGMRTAVEARLRAGCRIAFVDMYSRVSLGDLFDGLHPSAAGYKKMAQTWFEAIAVSLNLAAKPSVPRTVSPRRSWTSLDATFEANGRRLLAPGQQWEAHGMRILIEARHSAPAPDCLLITHHSSLVSGQQLGITNH